MTSLIGKEKRSCGPDEVKKCRLPKEPKKKKIEKKEDQAVEVKPPTPVCVEPQPPEYKEKVLFPEDSNDPIVQARATCLYDCAVEPYYTTFKDCEKRVTRKLLYTAETCHEETIDLMEAIDRCVKDTAFRKLK